MEKKAISWNKSEYWKLLKSKQGKKGEMEQ